MIRFIENNWITLLIVIVATSLVLAMIYNSQKPDRKTMDAGIPSAVFLTDGSTGDEVKNLQTYLNEKGETLIIDGVFGPLTRAAVVKYFGRPFITDQEYKELILNS